MHVDPVTRSRSVGGGLELPQDPVSELPPQIGGLPQGFFRPGAVSVLCGLGDGVSGGSGAAVAAACVDGPALGQVLRALVQLRGAARQDGGPALGTQRLAGQHLQQVLAALDVDANGARRGRRRRGRLRGGRGKVSQQRQQLLAPPPPVRQPGSRRGGQAVVGRVEHHLLPGGRHVAPPAGQQLRRLVVDEQVPAHRGLVVADHHPLQPGLAQPLRHPLQLLGDAGPVSGQRRRADQQAQAIPLHVRHGLQRPVHGGQPREEALLPHEGQRLVAAAGRHAVLHVVAAAAVHGAAVGPGGQEAAVPVH
mmetsp:Transcript_17288/g.25047  ORF Transcript_17288/g.25047 Transcript_17288/m.25047 type:complete len:307 (+) Transcript_17288:56-976(+)